MFTHGNKSNYWSFEMSDLFDGQLPANFQPTSSGSRLVKDGDDDDVGRGPMVN